ncbi:MAG: DMT family transporter [Planctomycetes bacterium]|nr:DMT family transporter [Planctomycetota bacterium]
MTALLTALALLAFAANSILCRFALADAAVDPASFTALRLVSGALVLWPLARVFGEPVTGAGARGSWPSAAALFAYAAGFSFAYVSLPAGVGALLLFGAVQATMLLIAARGGHGLRRAQWAGFAVAIAGLVVLVLPGLSAPEPFGAALMVVAGIAWGVYSVRGRGAASPVRLTAGNFARSAPLAVGLLLPFANSLHASGKGVALALASGIVTSGCGYVIWYRALRGLHVAQASVLQLLVPVLVAAAGIALLGEVLSPRLAGASLLILGGVAVAVWPRRAAGS